MLGHEDLVRRIGDSTLDRTVLNFDYAIDAGREDDDDGGGDGLDHDRTPAALEAIQGYDDELSQWSPEEEG